MERPKEWPLLAVSVPPVRFRPPDLPTLGRFSVPPRSPSLLAFGPLGRAWQKWEGGPGFCGLSPTRPKRDQSCLGSVPSAISRAAVLFE